MKYNALQRTIIEVGCSTKAHGGKGKMHETNQANTAVKREVQLAEWQQQIQARQDQGLTVAEWCIRLKISKGAYYHRLRKVREYLCQRMGVIENIEKDDVATETSRSVAVVPIRTTQPNKKQPLKCNSEICRSNLTKVPLRNS